MRKAGEGIAYNIFGNSFQNGLCYFEIPTHYAFLSALRQLQGMLSTLCRFNEGQLFVSIIETDFFHWLIQTFVWYILGLATFTKAAAISCKVKCSYIVKIKLPCKIKKDQHNINNIKNRTY